jgi:hypothetical protein
LIGLKWIEYGNESYAPPARLFVQNSVWGSDGLRNILSYQRPQPKTITAKIEYEITNSATEIKCFNPLVQTLITDYGTYTNVLHNLISYPIDGTNTSAPLSIPSSNVLPNEIIYRSSSTRIPKMGGLYLQRVVRIPFASLYLSTIN